MYLVLQLSRVSTGGRMLNFIQTHILRRRIQTKVQKARPDTGANKKDIKEKLQHYKPSEQHQRADFSGPRYQPSDFDTA